MIGENLRSIYKIDDNQILIRTKENIHVYKAVGDWGHEAWATNIPEYICRGIIRDVRDKNWIMTIITDGGYNDIELRVDYGYQGCFTKIK